MKRGIVVLREFARAHPPLAVFIVVLTVYAALFAHNRIRGAGHSDGYYSYLYARSLAYDQDIDFRNDYAVCGDPWSVGVDRGTGHPDNAAYVGPALFWTPVVWIGKHVVRLAPDASDRAKNGCEGPIVIAALGLSVVAGAAAVALACAAALRVASPSAACAAGLVFAFASNLPHYATYFVSISHAYEAFACALLIWSTMRAVESSGFAWWGAVGAAVALCALQRLSDGALIAIPFVILARAADRPAGARAVASLVVVAVGAIGVAITLGVYQFLYGSPFVLPQGIHYLHPTNAHPFLVLFAPQGGLLYATPIAYVALLGFIPAVRDTKTRSFAIGAAVAFALVLWAASSPLDWHGKATLGARRLVVAVPIFVVLAARAFESLSLRVRNPRARIAMFLAIGVVFGVPVLLATQAVRSGILAQEAGAFAPPRRIGAPWAAWKSLFESLGEVATLPAEVAYAARFGLPMRSFRAATTDRYYRRSYRTLAWEPNAIDLTDDAIRAASSGVAPEPSGVKLTSAEARLAFAAEWPFATDISVELDAPADADLAMAITSFWRTCPLGSQRVEAGSRRTARFVIPAGCFDSGLVELTIRSARFDGIVIRRILIGDSATYRSPF